MAHLHTYCLRYWIGTFESSFIVWGWICNYIPRNTGLIIVKDSWFWHLYQQVENLWAKQSEGDLGVLGPSGVNFKVLLWIFIRQPQALGLLGYLVVLIIWCSLILLHSSNAVLLLVNPYTTGKTWVRTQHCGYWCPGVKAPDHQYPLCWINTHCTGLIWYENITFIVNSIRKWSYMYLKQKRKKLFSQLQGLLGNIFIGRRKYSQENLFPRNENSHAN